MGFYLFRDQHHTFPHVPWGLLPFLLLSFNCWPSSDHPEEKHFNNIRQLTFKGDNGEAYFSKDGKHLIFQSKRNGHLFDQIYSINLDGSNLRRLSTGKGRATCSYFDPRQPQIIYSSTHHVDTGKEAEKKNRFSESSIQGTGKRYEWEFHSGFDIFLADLQGHILKNLTHQPGYDAEATFSPSGKRIIFTSNRDGDLEIYSMDRNGEGVRRLTYLPGYDGGAFYSPDEKKIIFRGARGDDYRSLQLFVMDSDGSKVRQLTHFPGTNFAPFWHPSGNQIIFCSNHRDFRNFDLFLLDIDSGAVEQVTFNPSFDGFPVFSANGRYLVFASNRAADQEGQTHIFVAEWQE